jgi:hypothetical protein
MSSQVSLNADLQCQPDSHVDDAWLLAAEVSNPEVPVNLSFQRNSPGSSSSSLDLALSFTRRPVEDLKPHPAFSKCRIAESMVDISKLSARGDLVFDEPITITQDGFVIGNYPLWKFACMQKRPTVLCHQRQMNEDEGLLFLITDHHRSKGLNNFVRIFLALELEPWLRARAQANQAKGGRLKHLSNLTKAETVDVRAELASAAGASSGNVTKVKRLVEHAAPELLEALASGEISIHRAWQWSTDPPARQVGRLSAFRFTTGTKRTIQCLLKKHKHLRKETGQELRDLRKSVAGLRNDEELLFVAAPLDEILSRIDQRLAFSGGHDAT